MIITIKGFFKCCYKLVVMLLRVYTHKSNKITCNYIIY